jgi:hypothetical protein
MGFSTKAFFSVGLSLASDISSAITDVDLGQPIFNPRWSQFQSKLETNEKKVRRSLGWNEEEKNFNQSKYFYVQLYAYVSSLPQTEVTIRPDYRLFASLFIPPSPL